MNRREKRLCLNCAKAKNARKRQCGSVPLLSSTVWHAMQGIKLRDSFLGSSTLFSLELCAYFDTWILSKRYKWLHDTSDCMIDVLGCADKAPLDRNRKIGTGGTKDKQSVWGCSVDTVVLSIFSSACRAVFGARRPRTPRGRARSAGRGNGKKRPPRRGSSETRRAPRRPARRPAAKADAGAPRRGRPRARSPRSLVRCE